MSRRRSADAIAPASSPAGTSTHDEVTDAALLELCIEGDESAWRALVFRYRNLVYSTALGVGLDADDAGDVFQEVWFELHRSMRRIRRAEAIPKWLVVATRRLSYKVAVRRRRSVAGVSRDLVDPATLSDEAYSILRTRHKLEEGLARLGDPCAKLLRLLFLETETISYEEISKRTGLPIGSIGPNRARCLEKLRKILGEDL